MPTKQQPTAEDTLPWFVRLTKSRGGRLCDLVPTEAADGQWRKKDKSKVITYGP